MTTFCLEVAGPFACFTRPEMKVERVSYDVMTPSSARSIFEAILWKPAIRWRVHRIEVLKPLRWINLRRNEVSAVVSTRNVQQAMTAGSGTLGLYIEDERQQRAGYFLREVAYRIHADLSLMPGRTVEPLMKYTEMFARRASKGQCVNQPYLGAGSLRLTSAWLMPPRQRPHRPLPKPANWAGCCTTLTSLILPIHNPDFSTQRWSLA